MRTKCTECGAYGIHTDDEVQLTCGHDADHKIEYFCPSCQEFQEPDNRNQCPRCDVDLSRFHNLPEPEPEEPDKMVIISDDGSPTYHQAVEVDGVFEAACGRPPEEYTVVPESDVGDRRQCKRCYNPDEML